MPQKSPVQPKKHLGQHFLTDLNIAQQIAQTLSLCGYKQVLEIGPGTGVLTQFLLEKDAEVFVIEIDKESVAYLQAYCPKLKGHILSEDFLKFDIVSYFNKTPFAIIGNFPYNISSQIVFLCLSLRVCSKKKWPSVSVRDLVASLTVFSRYLHRLFMKQNTSSQYQNMYLILLQR